MKVDISEVQHTRLQRTASKLGKTLEETLDNLLDAWFGEFEGLEDIYIGLSDERYAEREKAAKLRKGNDPLPEAG